MMTHPENASVAWSHSLFTRWLLPACLVGMAVTAGRGDAATNSPTTLAAFAGKLTGEAPPPTEPLSLWYRQPATVWTSAPAGG